MIDCPFCGTTFRGAPSRRERRARCRSCNTVFVVPAATNLDFEQALDRELAEEEGRGRRLRGSARFAASLTILCGLAATPIAVLTDAVVVGSQGYLLPLYGTPLVRAGTGLIALVLVVGGIGLCLRKPWGWWGAFLGFLAGCAFYTNLAVPIFLHLRWEHAAANSVAIGAGLGYGGPLLLFLFGALLLLSSKVRVAFGVKSPPQRSRPPVRAGSRRP